MPGNGDNGECSLSKEVISTKNSPACKEETGCPHPWQGLFPSMWCGTTGPPRPASASQSRFLFLKKAGGAAVQKRGFIAEERVPTLTTGCTHCQCSAFSGWALLSGSPGNFLIKPRLSSAPRDILQV